MILGRREKAMALAKTLEDDIEVRIDEAEAELNTFSNNQVRKSDKFSNVKGICVLF